MKITVFTSNQPRHLGLIRNLADLADEVHAIIEASPVLSHLSPSFSERSKIMRNYFSRMAESEEKIFGRPRPLPSNVRALPLAAGDLNRIELKDLNSALQSDIFVVFGASYIKGPLCDFLVEREALNLHMGVSPYYRGAACNFWALYDKRPEYVGSTIHRLTKGLDSGDILFHALPKAEACDPFDFGMKAVLASHTALTNILATPDFRKIKPTPQKMDLQIRYSRICDFTDEIATDYLAHAPSFAAIGERLQHRDLKDFIRPWIPAI